MRAHDRGETGSLMFIYDVNSAIVSAQNQSNAVKLIEQCFSVQMDNDPKHKVRATQGESLIN